MIIGIDIRPIASGNKTGIEEYTYQVLKRIIANNDSIKFKLFYNAYKNQNLNLDWIQNKNTEIINLKIPNRILDLSIRFSGYPKIESMIGEVDKFFSPHIFSIYNKKECEKITTFHDLSFEKYSEFYSKSKNFWHFTMNPRLQAEKSNKIIAVSNSTKDDLVNIYKINPEKIRVIYSGINEDLYKTTTEEEKNKIREKYNIKDNNYILYLGTLEPRKNISGIIKAFAQSKTQGKLKKSNIKLVIAGSKGWLYKEIFQTAKNLNIQNEIIFTGFIKEEDKSVLYEMAELFIYPSFYEGFGFPPLEAMAKKTPVITSSISSLPEAVGDCAIMINPHKPQEIKESIETILFDQDLRNIIIEKAIERTKKFKWDKCAKETFDFIIE